MSTFTEHPPVPQVLQEALKDYPELIAQLEEGLRTVGRSPGMSRTQRGDQLEQARWSLEIDMDAFIGQASAEIALAKTHGDLEKSETARQKLRVLQLHRRDGGEELMMFFGWGQD